MLDRLSYTIFLIFCLPNIVFACSVCYGDPSSSSTAGLRGGILALLAVLLVVMLSFSYFFWQIWNRTRSLNH